MSERGKVSNASLRCDGAWHKEVREGRRHKLWSRGSMGVKRSHSSSHSVLIDFRCRWKIGGGYRLHWYQRFGVKDRERGMRDWVVQVGQRSGYERAHGTTILGF